MLNMSCMLLRFLSLSFRLKSRGVILLQKAVSNEMFFAVAMTSSE